MEELSSDAPTIRLADIAGGSRHKATGAMLPMRSRVLLNVVDHTIVRGHTLDITEKHLAISAPTALACGQECAVFVALTIADQTYTIVGTGQITGCVMNDRGNYNIDLDFKVSDRKSQIVIEQLFSSSNSNRVQ